MLKFLAKLMHNNVSENICYCILSYLAPVKMYSIYFYYKPI